MKFKYHLLLILSITLFSCREKSPEQKVETNKEVFNSASQFAELVLGKRLRIHFTEYKRGEVGVDALFESDGMIGYTTFSNELYQKVASPIDIEGCILFAAKFKDVESAIMAFNQLKSNSEIPASEVKGMVGITPVQIRFLEQIRNDGALFTQKDNYVFCLPKTCESPLAESYQQDYEHLLLSFITENNEEIEVIKTDCAKDKYLIQKIKASK